MFWKKKRKQVGQAVDEAAQAVTELADASLTIGPAGVLLLLGAAAAGAAATYYVTKARQKKKSAP
jgi:hypothetical protein